MSRAKQVCGMEDYVFKLLSDDGAILQIHSTAHRELSAVWSEIARLARRPDMIGGHIVVTNLSGEVIILVGAATARAYRPGSNDESDAEPGDFARSEASDGRRALMPIQRPRVRKFR
jgi:hypothetical protein